MVTSLAIFLALYLTLSTGLDSMSGATVSVIAVSVPARTGEKRERTTHHHREQAACLQTKGDSRNVT